MNLQLNAGERIGITGPNGAGKSTLLRLLLGVQRPDSGDASWAPPWRRRDRPARGLLAGPLKLADAVEAVLTDQTQAKSDPAGQIGLKADTLPPGGLPVAGERTRAALALLQARGVNLLVLDEPTNHLDLPAIEQLEQEALEGYDGALLLVTHDRRLLENVRLDARWNVDNASSRELWAIPPRKATTHEHGPGSLELPHNITRASSGSKPFSKETLKRVFSFARRTRAS